MTNSHTPFIPELQANLASSPGHASSAAKGPIQKHVLTFCCDVSLSSLSLEHFFQFLLNFHNVETFEDQGPVIL